MRKITPLLEKQVCEWREQGMKLRVIANRLNITLSTVRAILINNGVNDTPDNYMEEWLQTHWGPWEYKPPKRKKEVEYRGKYRVVHKGDHTNFRTPYRPDGIWR